ncbi:glycerophosphodiester phosphodiesterase family protein [candidate division KSB1 bacterium]|nr:glycerophosphodiester phosphodiesterase family protein [candidate division KSB1 bacterium]
MVILKNGEPFYQWPGIKVVGHRGNVKFAPENTIPAFETAFRLGADLVELDIRETKDGVLVIMHDESVDRTTNGTGKVADMTLAEIKNLDAGSWFGPEFKGVQVPTFKEVLQAIKGKTLPDIDFKAGSPDKLIKILKEEGLLGKVTLYSDNWDLLNDTIKLSNGFFLRPTVPNGYYGLPILINELDSPIININWEEFSEKLVRETHIAGKKSFLNVMQHDNEFGIQLMINAMPDYLQSDNLDILVPLLRAKGLHK